MGPVYQVVLMICMGFLNSLVMLALLAVALWTVVRALAIAVAGFDTAQDSFE